MIHENTITIKPPVNPQYQTNTLIGRTVKHLALYNKVNDINNFLEDILNLEDVDDYPEVLTTIINYVKPSDIVY